MAAFDSQLTKIQALDGGLPAADPPPPVLPALKKAIETRDRSGVNDALRQIIEEHGAGLKNYIKRKFAASARISDPNTVDDIFQDVLVSLVRIAKNIDCRHSDRAYLYQIASCRTIDALRKTRNAHREIALDAPIPGRPPGSGTVADLILDRRPDRTATNAAAYRIAEFLEQRAQESGQSRSKQSLLVLHKLLGTKKRELAKLEGISLEAVKHRVRAEIKAVLQHFGKTGDAA